VLDVPQEDDKVVDAEDLRIYVDPFSCHYIENLQIDWVETKYGADFHFQIR
jgi:Fe-S cluster assembly iron-binding protein IscA